jgi:hypothetical protein
MATTLTRLYDYHADADRAVTDLRQAGLASQDIRLEAGPEPGVDRADRDATEAEFDAHPGGIKRGGTIITVYLPEGREAEFTRILDRYPAIDPANEHDV